MTGFDVRTESELKDLKVAWFDTRTRGEVKNTTIIDNDGPGWTSQRSVTLRYHQDLWPVPHVEVVIDNTTVASFIGSNAYDQAMAFYNDPSRLKLHAPKHAPLRMPQGNTDA